MPLELEMKSSLWMLRAFEADSLIPIIIETWDFLMNLIPRLVNDLTTHTCIPNLWTMYS